MIKRNIPSKKKGTDMQPLRRLWCRTFQGVFRLALPVLPYRSPERLHAMEDIPALCAQLETVTKEQVAQAAQKLQLDTIYFLKGKEGQHE